MAGAHEVYDYMPYFFSDLFNIGYEAVGEVDSRLEVVTDWQKENEKGIIYYKKDGRVRGLKMCNVWDKVQKARDIKKKDRESIISKKDAQILLKNIPEWSLHEKAIAREFTFKDFHQAIEFVDGVSKLSEKENHHPDIFVSYNKVKIDFYTHKVDGLTSKDFELASAVDRLS